jgi:hypothetical protein
MKANKWSVAAAVVAVTAVAGEAWAEEVCAGAQDLTALQVAAVQQQMVVAALACGKDGIYNDFVTTYQDELISSDQALQAYFMRRAPKTGTDDYHAFKTKMANYYSARSSDNRTVFCSKADALFHDALSGPKKSLAAFALAQPMNINIGYTGCGQPVQGESFAMQGVKEEPREEKPAPAEPAIAAAPPVTPPPAPPQQFAQNFPPVSPRAVVPPVAPRFGAPARSYCTRMSNFYLDCWYGNFHYYRDPYGRYLPPPAAYRRGY